MPATQTYRRLTWSKALALVAVAAGGVGLYAALKTPAVAQSSKVYTQGFHSFVPADPLDRRKKKRAGNWRQTMRAGQQALTNGDFKAAREFFGQSLDAGNIWAAWYLGWIHEYGYGVKRNPAKAFDYFNLVAKEADLDRARRRELKLAVDALVRVANAYRTGLKSAGVRQHPLRAYNIYMAMAAYRHPGSDHGLGLMYINGVGVSKNATKGLLRLRRAARNGYVPSQLLLSTFHLKGRYLRHDRVRAFMWYILARQSEGQRNYPELSGRIEPALANATPQELEAATIAARRWIQMYGSQSPSVTPTTN